VPLSQLIQISQASISINHTVALKNALESDQSSLKNIQVKDPKTKKNSTPQDHKVPHHGHSASSGPKEIHRGMLCLGRWNYGGNNLV